MSSLNVRNKIWGSNQWCRDRFWIPTCVQNVFETWFFVGVGLCFCIVVFVQITVVRKQNGGFPLHSRQPNGLGDDKDMNVAIFVQVGNTDGAVWQDLYACIANVALSQRNDRNTTGHRYLSLFVSTLDPGHANLLRINASSLQGFLQIIVQTVKNRGADVGQFLQQIQATTVQNFDAILKIHYTKSDRQHRQWMLTHLCGTPQAASIPSTLALYKTYRGADGCQSSRWWCSSRKGRCSWWEYLFEGCRRRCQHCSRLVRTWHRHQPSC